jgi:hypothetical protein
MIYFACLQICHFQIQLTLILPATN